MPPDPRVHAGVAAWVMNDKAEILVTKRGDKGYGADGAGTYSIPGGWIDFGETPFETAEREVLEETGVVVRAVNQDCWTYFTSDNGEFEVVNLVIHCEYMSGTPTNVEYDKCDWVGWMSLSELYKQPLFRPLAQYLGVA